MSGGADAFDAGDPQRPPDGDLGAWRAHWQRSGQLWRTEPEIDEQRQQELTARRSGGVGAVSGSPPFEGFGLGRADVEWLLATHEDGCGPIDWDDQEQRTRPGLDLRGAVLTGVDLSALPLACLRAGTDKPALTDGSTDLRAACLEEADLRGAHLEGCLLNSARFGGAVLEYAHLEGSILTDTRFDGANLRWAHLEGAFAFAQPSFKDAQLLEAHLEGAVLGSARFEGAELGFACLQGAVLKDARLERASLGGAHLEGADLSNAHLEGALLLETHLGGARLENDDWKRIRKWSEGTQQTLEPAKLWGAFFDAATNLERVDLGDAERGCPHLADVRWGGVNLAVADWEPLVNNLGDDRVARSSEARGFRREAVVQDHQWAVRANRQLALVLREQGLNEVANRFAFRGQEVQQKVLWMERRAGEFLLLFVSRALAGYGYKPLWTFYWYCGVVLAAAALYYVLGRALGEPMGAFEALVGSVTAFHGRGLFETDLNTWQGAVAAVEAVFGLLIEICLIVTFTQRFFGK